MSLARSCHLLSLLSVIAVSACGIESSLVGGRCADGLEQSGTRCVRPGPTLITPADPPDGSPDGASGASGQTFVDGGAHDGAATVAPLGKAPIDTGPTVLPPIDAGPVPLLCALPLVECRGACISVSSDGLNCGACGKICPSNICVAGECQGATPGDVVLIGHDFSGARAGTAQAKVLVNALSIPTTDPIRVLSYDLGTSAQAAAQVNAIAVAGVYGRKLQFTSAGSASTLESSTLVQSYDVVLLQDAVSDDPTALGARWAASLQKFAAKGGVVVALDNATSPMPALLTSAGLIAVGGHFKLPDNTHLVVTAAGDVVGAQVLSPYATTGPAIAFTGVAFGGADLSWVVRRDDGAGAGEPIVVHRLVR